jgi:hypothetical protein
VNLQLLPKSTWCEIASPVHRAWLSVAVSSLGLSQVLHLRSLVPSEVVLGHLLFLLLSLAELHTLVTSRLALAIFDTESPLATAAKCSGGDETRRTNQKPRWQVLRNRNGRPSTVVCP